MKKITFIFLLFIAANLYGEVDFQLDLASRYIWRGFDIFHDNKPAWQPSLTYTFGDSGFSINLWSSYALDGREELKYLDETDLTLMYELGVSDKISLVAGFIHYGWYRSRNFSFKNSTTQEFFLIASLPYVPLTPSLSVFYDVNIGDGIYILLDCSHSVAMNNSLDLTLTASLGYNGDQYVDDSGLSDLTLGMSLPISLNGITISPYINYCIVFLDSVNDDNELWLGLSISL